MDFSPEDVRSCLEDARYPTSKEDMISIADSNRAPDYFIQRIGTLGRAEFSEPGGVVAELSTSFSSSDLVVYPRLLARSCETSTRAISAGGHGLLDRLRYFMTSTS
ncbi:MAG: DUF2795 domain-containing protein [Rubrobacter sp.]|nr:DUF2795 domain-containing protein [Rubrobacter sp.]